MMSARSAYRARVAVAALALALATSAAAAHATSVTLSNVHLNAKWKEGWLTAKLHFTVKADGATSVQASVRPVKPGPVAKVQHYTFAQAGSAAETIPMPARLKPGDYLLKVGSATSKFTVPTPAEGVVDSAVVSKAKGGPSAKAVSGPRKLWVRFHFLVAPQNAKNVKIEWRTPSFTFVGAKTLPYSPTVDASVSSNLPLPKGTWYALLVVNSKVAKRQDVQVT
jgi:methionine-rich copper-binding protein CopC